MTQLNEMPTRRDRGDGSRTSCRRSWRSPRRDRSSSTCGPRGAVRAARSVRSSSRWPRSDGGEFLLAKLDVDANPYTAGQFGVQSIPTVIAFKDGRPVDGFVGAIPEPMVREFVGKLLPTEADREAEEAFVEEQEGDLDDAETKYREALEADPKNRDARLGLGRVLVETMRDDEARETLMPLLPDAEAERFPRAARGALVGERAGGRDARVREAPRRQGLVPTRRWTGCSARCATTRTRGRRWSRSSPCSATTTHSSPSTGAASRTPCTDAGGSSTGSASSGTRTRRRTTRLPRTRSRIPSAPPRGARSSSRRCPEPPALVLDAGAGTGALSLLAAELGYDVTALDLSSGMLAEAERKAADRGLDGRMRFVVGSVTEPPERPLRRRDRATRALDRSRLPSPRFARGATWLAGSSCSRVSGGRRRSATAPAPRSPRRSVSRCGRRRTTTRPIRPTSSRRSRSRRCRRRDPSSTPSHEAGWHRRADQAVARRRVGRDPARAVAARLARAPPPLRAGRRRVTRHRTEHTNTSVRYGIDTRSRPVRSGSVSSSSVTSRTTSARSSGGALAT